MSTTGIQSVLIFDPDPFYRRIIYNLLLAFEIPLVVQTTTYQEARDVLQTRPFDCIVMDWDMEGKSRLKLAEHLRVGKLGTNLETPIILCTAHTRRERIFTARDAGISEIIVKPVSPEQMLNKMMASCFRMRKFVRSDGYNGPDRRRRDAGYEGPNRRKSDMKQDDIDKLMEEGTAK